MIEVRGIRKAFGSNVVLRGIDMDIPRASVVVILGPSGSGKTTFLRCLNALETPDAGTVSFDGEHPFSVDFSKRLSKQEILRLRRASGMVFQQYNLFPHKTALENVMEGPLMVQKRPEAEVRAEAEVLLEKVGLAAQKDLYPYQLSGGQQQRVGIARALAIKPQLMLFDEPTSALDPELVQDVLDTMKQLAAEGRTMVVVTHEIAFAMEVADHVILMDGGVIVEQGSPKELFDNHQHPLTKKFLGRIRRDA